MSWHGDGSGRKAKKEKRKAAIIEKRNGVASLAPAGSSGLGKEIGEAWRRGLAKKRKYLVSAQENGAQWCQRGASAALQRALSSQHAPKTGMAVGQLWI